MDEQKKNKGGAKPLPIGDLIIAMCLATYRNHSSRKATAKLHCPIDLFARKKVPAAISLRYAMKKSDLTTWLHEAILLCVQCVRDIEQTFAIDSTYFKTPNYGLHVARQGRDMVVIEKIKNAKAHVAVGIETLMIVGIDVSDGEEADTTYFRRVLNQFSKFFVVKKVLADAGYAFDDNVKAVLEVGGDAYFDVKTNTKTTGDTALAEMARRRLADKDEWESTYGFRSLIETTNSMLKRNLKRIIRARLETSRKNEILLMCLVHNLCRLMVARIEHGIDIPWAQASTINLLDQIAWESDEEAA
jgi:transposase